MDEEENIQCGVKDRPAEFLLPEDRDMETLPLMDPLWAQLIECWHCGGRTCEIDHEKERAIRIADMQFVRDIVVDKRELEAQLAKLLADMESTKAREKLWDIEKRMLLQQIAEKEEAENRWKKDQMLLEQEIQRLRNVNEMLQQQVDIYRRNEGKVEMLQLRLDSVIEETTILKIEIKRLNDSNYQKILEIEKLKKEKEALKADIVEMKEENARLKSELAKVKKELTELKNDTSKDDLIDELRIQVAQLEKDKNEALNKNEKYIITIRQLNLLITEMELQFTTSERLRLQLQQEVEELTAELLALKRRLNADKTFKKFVKIKRELNNVKDENEDLRDIVKTNVSPFPTYMKEDTSYNPAKIAQKAVEIVTGTKLKSDMSNDGSLHRVQSAPTTRHYSDDELIQLSFAGHTDGDFQPRTPRPSTAPGVRFADGSVPGLGRPKTARGKLRTISSTSSIAPTSPDYNANIERGDRRMIKRTGWTS